MAKKNAIPGPSTAELMGELPTESSVVTVVEQKPAEATPEPPTEPSEVLLSAYVSRTVTGYISVKAEARLDAKQGRALKALFEGLHSRHEKLDNGKHVDSPPAALKWLLERIADQMTEASATSGL